MPFRFESLPVHVARGEPRQCFYNAFVAMMDNDGLTYCEGFACGDSEFAHLHAWCIDEDGVVVDPTWESGVEYVGVPFSSSFVLKSVLKSGCSLIDDWKKKWPLLSGAVSVESVISCDWFELWEKRPVLC